MQWKNYVMELGGTTMYLRPRNRRHEQMWSWEAPYFKNVQGNVLDIQTRKGRDWLNAPIYCKPKKGLF
jgi:hypothetical protein